MKLKRIIVIALIVIAVAMVGVGIYFMNSSKYIFKKALSGVFDYTVDSYVKLTDKLDNSKSFEKFKLTTNNSLKMYEMEFATVSGDVYIDSKDEKFYANLDSTVMGEELLGAEALLSDNVMYAKLKEAMDIFYFIELEDTTLKDAFVLEDSSDDEGEFSEIDYSKILELEKEELENLTNHLENSILKDISNKDIKKSSEKIKQDNKEVKMTKVSLKISEKRQNEILVAFLEAISNDNEAIKTLQKIDKNITKKAIQGVIDELNENTNLDDNVGIILSFYVKGFNDLARIDVESYYDREIKQEEVFSAHIIIDIFKNKNKNDTTIFTVERINNYGGIGSETVSFEFEQATDDMVNITVKSEDTVAITGTFEKTDNVTELKLNWPEAKGSFELKETIVKKNQEYVIEIKFIEETSLIEFNSTNTLIVDEEMPEVDVDGAINFEEVTTEDSQKIIDYVEEKLAGIGLSDLYEEDNCIDFNCVAQEDDYIIQDE